ncbi:hypothetical protein PQV03_14205 [Thermoanaerobacterium thermosaccharolyticum]|uniref:hypothetical protein n=1 Tax=Thermoanaerobacterium thermosaccharolyticum TaxID=1517 RepID=UPI003D2DDD86
MEYINHFMSLIKPYDNVIFGVITPIAAFLLILTYAIDKIKLYRDNIITYTKNCGKDLKDLIKNVDKNILNDINMKEFTIGKYAFKAGQKAIIVTNWNEQYSGTILGMNNIGVIYLLLNDDGDVYALDIRGIKCLNLV